ncbi:MAG: histidine--tRNA ligase [bacterium]|nr:histidine--tRNA ligase [bacterium]
MKIQKLSTDSYKGVRDFYPEDMRVQNYIFNTWRKTLQSFGYEEYAASILEPSELYEAKTGEEIINEQTYSFIDRGDRKVTLRPEMTPTVARMVAGRRHELAFPLRLFSIPNLFRYERPQKGRLREHFQLNADIFGDSTRCAEIEMIQIASALMKNFGIKEYDFEIRISSRRLINAVMSEWYELDEEGSKKLMKLIDRKGKMSEEDFTTKAREISGDAFQFFSFDPMSEVYEEAMALLPIRVAKEELDGIINDLKSRGISNVIFDSELIRGFDYYTGTIFEVFDKHKENNRALFGGGRYDELLSLFGGDNVPAVGFGMGDVTIYDALTTYNLIPDSVKQSVIDVSLLCIDENAIVHAEKVADELREKNVNVALNTSLKKIGDQIKHAEKTGITYIIAIGENEIKSGEYTLKNIVTGDETKGTLPQVCKSVTIDSHEKDRLRYRN